MIETIIRTPGKTPILVSPQGDDWRLSQGANTLLLSRAETEALVQHLSQPQSTSPARLQRFVVA